MSPTLKLTKLVLRQDGRYDCEVSVKGYWQREYNKVNKNGTEYVTGVKSEEYHKFTKNQKVVMVIEEKDLGEDLCKLMDNVRDYIEANPTILEQLKQFETVSLQVDDTEMSPEAQQAACDAEQCSFPECDHVCGYNPDKDDPDPYPCTDPQCYDAGNYHVSCPGGCPKHK